MIRATNIIRRLLIDRETWLEAGYHLTISVGNSLEKVGWPAVATR